MPTGTLEKVQHVIITIVNFSPVVLVCLLLTWSFLAFDLSFCRALLSDGHVFQGIAYMLIIQPVGVMVIWSYLKAVRTSPGYTTDFVSSSGSQMQPEDEEETISGVSQNLGGDVGMQPLLQRGTRPSAVMVKRDGSARFCQKCNLPKYDRTHHCRTCKKCILKMDHHCPWLNNCIGHKNHKHFYLFLVYCSLYCIFIFVTTLPETITVLNSELGIFALDLNWPFLVFFSGLFGLFLVPFTVFHTNQILQNRTTIESYERSNFIMGHRRNRDVLSSRYFNAWNLGKMENVIQVLGNDRKRWFLPVGIPEGDGASFPLSSYAYNTLIEEDTSDRERDLEQQ